MAALAIQLFSVYVTLLVAVVVVCITPSSQQQPSARTANTHDGLNEPSAGNSLYHTYEVARNFLLDSDGGADNLVKSVPYFRASIPMRVYECLRGFSILRCTKLYALQKMEASKRTPSTGNLTQDFLDQFFGHEDHMGSLISDKYTQLSEQDLNQQLMVHFQRFFKHRDLKLHFLPGIMVRIVPSKENKLVFSLKQPTNARSRALKTGSGDADDTTGSDLLETEKQGIGGGIGDGGGGGIGGGGGGIGEGDSGGIGGGGGLGGGIRQRVKNKNKKSAYSAMIQLAVPVMVLPAILMGSFLPFILPVLKLATIMTLVMNNSAFVAALIYAAKTHANSQDEQHISYGPHPAYH